MSEFFQIVYVDTRSSGKLGGMPDYVISLRDWSMMQSPFARWRQPRPGEFNPDETNADALKKGLEDIRLIVLDWTSENTRVAQGVCKRIRKFRTDTPILIIASTLGRAPARDSFRNEDRCSWEVKTEDLLDARSIADVFAKLKLNLPSPEIKLDYDSNHLTIQGLIESIGHENLRRMVQTYFPQARIGHVRPVSGGWSDAKLCRLYIDGNEYFMKFFTDAVESVAEIGNHSAARKWLGTSLVALKYVPGIDGDVPHHEAFPAPPSPPAIYPICYESAAGKNRDTLQELYRTGSDDFVEGALGCLLDVLAKGQTRGATSHEPPWSNNPSSCVTPKARRSLLETLEDLKHFGPGVFGSENEWKQSHNAIRMITLSAALPDWLAEPCPVVQGHIHGDPNPRNCLVNAENHADLQLIDSGGYREDGRLVSDLALIERDIKLVLMDTDLKSGRFFELDATRIPAWCRAEEDSIQRKLDYAPDNAPRQPESVRRAYRLVAQVRQRAAEMSRDDKGRRHYFGALLLLTLDVLQYKAVRRTKKLLALYSAARILQEFDR